MVRVLGIDSSLTATGLARIELEAIDDDDPLAAYIADTAVVSAPKPGKDKSKRAMARRVNALLDKIEWCFLADQRPDYVGLEALAYGARGEGAWVLPWIFGRVIELTEKHDVPLTVVATSARAKFATGKGNAPKDTVLIAATRLFSEADLRDNNEADAMIVGAVVCQAIGLPIVPVTQYRTDVVAALGN